MKILCLFVRHGAERYPDALKVLNLWYETHGLKNERLLWIIDNSRAPGLRAEQLDSQTFLRSGDNDAWEFSAWSLALREAQAEGILYDVVHFVTSAFNTLYTEYLKHFERDMLSCVLKRGVCLSHIDSYSKPVRLGAAKSQSWVRTCFFFLPGSAIASISPWIAYRDPAIFFVAANTRQFRPDAPLSLDYQEQITSWLEGQEMGGHTWHSPVRHGPEENRRFQQKTLAILNEHHLTITFRSAGVKMVDFCWLYSLRKNHFLEGTEPIAELDQLKVRRKILGIPE